MNEGEFDIIHTRLVVENIAPRLAVLTKLVTALRPGGWLLVEDFDFSAWLYLPEERLFCEPREIRATYLAAARSLASLGGSRIDMEFGRDLPLHLVDAGLESVASEACAPLILGGTPQSDYITMGARQLSSVLVDTGIPRADVDRLIDTFEKPGAMVSQPPMVSAWGRRPS